MFFQYNLCVILVLTVINNVQVASQNTECSQGPGAPSADDPESCPSQCEAFDPEAKTFLLRDSNGRLGNQMFAYMLLLSMNMQFGYRPLLSRRTFNSLNPFFANLGMDVAEDVVCDFNETYSAYRGHIKEQRMELIADYIRKQVGHDIELVKDDKGRWKLPPQVANDPNIDTERVIHSEKFKSVDVSQVPPSSYPWEVFTQDRLIMELAKAEYQTGRAVILFPENYSASRNESRFINNGPGVLEALTKTFTLRGHFMESAEVRLNHIRAIHMEKMATKSGKKGKKSKKPITFVGIHSRRTDHLSFEQELGQVPLKPSYYLEAMEMYREMYKNVIFIFISDDVEWGKSNLILRNKAGDLYFGGQGLAEDQSSIGHDLALMSLCNHTIISYGTFSFWVGFLAGGSVILPRHFPQYRTSKADIDAYTRHPLKDPLPRLHPYLQ